MKKTSEQYELMEKGEPYRFDDFLFSLQRKCARKLARVNRIPFGSPVRDRILSRLFGSIGEGNVIKGNFLCNFGFNITMGDGCYINHGVIILDSFPVVLGNNVFLAPGVIISAVTHPLLAKDRRQLLGKTTVLEDDVWVGAGAVILPGVTVHKGAVIGAGAVVTSDVPENTVVAGVPAKEIRKINN